MGLVTPSQLFIHQLENLLHLTQVLSLKF